MTAQFLTELMLTAMLRAAVRPVTAETVISMKMRAKYAMTVPTTRLTVTATHGATVQLLTAATAQLMSWKEKRATTATMKTVTPVRLTA